MHFLTADQLKKDAINGLFHLKNIEVSSFRKDNECINFCITNHDDLIQKHHLRGEFYEREELSIISNAFEPGESFIDIGSNVGNHSVFVGKFLKPAHILAFEPNPEAYNALFANIVLNNLLDKFDFSGLGVGLSDERTDNARMKVPSSNIGAARVIGSGGDIKLIRGDDVLIQRKVDFLKIDVEGLEIGVLSGLRKTIDTHRPKIFIEVNNENRNAFFDFMARESYTVKDNFKRYPANENFLIFPQELE